MEHYLGLSPSDITPDHVRKFLALIKKGYRPEDLVSGCMVASYSVRLF